MRIVYRRARPEERPFIVSTWRASLRRSAYAGMIRTSHWKAVMDPEIGAVLDHPDTRVLVIADPTVDDGIADLFGHLVWQPGDQLVVDGERLTRAPTRMPLVFFLYVKHDYRERGLARGLMKAAGIDVAGAYNFVCRTYATDSLIDAGKLPRARWRPLLGRALDGDEHERDSETAP